MISQRTLIFVAAVIWYAGAVFVTLKGIRLTWASSNIHLGGIQWHWFALACGIGLGILKAKFILTRSSRRNIQRIGTLPTPRWWNAYPLWFYPLLGLMILSGRVMVSWAGTDYYRLCAIVVAYFMIGIGLSLGGLPFFEAES